MDATGSAGLYYTSYVNTITSSCISRPVAPYHQELRLQKNMDTVIATLTLTGSFLSSIANAFVLVSFFIYRHQIRHMRHTLVLNLTVAGKTSQPGI